jgi:hypothetical protein
LAPKTGFPPQAFLIGAQKCSTTFLADCIAAHPQVELSKPKEPDFFTRHFSKGQDWYRRCFRQTKDHVLLDASTSYSMAPTDPEQWKPDNPVWRVAERISLVSPQAKLIYVVRDPVARVHSSYWHGVRAGYERRGLLEAIRTSSGYLDGSRYHFQINRYYENFPSENLLILDMSDVTRQTEATLLRIWTHLDLPPIETGGVDRRQKRNPSYQYNGVGRWIIQEFLPQERIKYLAAAARKMMPSYAYNGLRRALTKDIPKFTEEQRFIIEGELREDTRKFGEQTGILFSS